MADFNPYLPAGGTTGPSARAVQGLGEGITNFILALSGKLEQSEYVVQMNKGQEYVQRKIADFNLERAADPDWQHYGDKWAEFRDQLESDIVGQNGFVTNNRARQDMNTWWSQTREAQREHIDQLQFNARVAQTQSDFTKLAQQHQSDVASGKETPDQFDDSVQKMGNLLVATNVVHGADMQYNYAQWRKSNELAYLRHLANDATSRSGDPQQGLDIIDQATFDPNYGHLDATDFAKVRQDVVTWQRIRESEANKKADQTNQNLDSQVNEMVTKLDWGGAMKFIADNQKNYLGTVGDKAEDGITKWRRTYDFIQQAEGRYYSSARKAIEDENINETYLRIHTEIMQPNFDAAQIGREIAVASSGHEITPKMGDHLASLIKPDLLDKSFSYESLFAEQAKANAKDGGVAGEWRMAQGLMREFIRKNPDVKAEGLSAVMHDLEDKAKHNIALSKVDDILKEEYGIAVKGERAAAGPYTPPRSGGAPAPSAAPPSSPPTEKPVPKAPPLSSFTKQNGYQTTVNGINYVLMNVNGKATIKWYDGKAWQILQ